MIFFRIEVIFSVKDADNLEYNYPGEEEAREETNTQEYEEDNPITGEIRTTVIINKVLFFKK